MKICCMVVTPVFVGWIMSEGRMLVICVYASVCMHVCADMHICVCVIETNGGCIQFHCAVVSPVFLEVGS